MKTLKTLTLPAILLMLSAACTVAQTGDPNAATPEATAEAPHDVYSNETYAAALRSASFKLRGELPQSWETHWVLTEGRTAYESRIDAYLTSPQLAPTLRTWFRSQYGLGDGMVTVVDPVSAANVNVNLDGPANLATYLVVNDLPWTGILDADYCVDNALSPVACTGNTPANERAGILSDQAFLRMYGKSEAFNFQRVSMTEQLTSCSIYPVADSPLTRRNDDAAATPADDPAVPPRIHAKYQGAMQGDEGSEIACHACHSALISRRAAFAKFDVDGFYDVSRTISDVENPTDNGDKCYVVPPGLTVGDLKTCDDVTFDPLTDGCCYDATFTDPNASDNDTCSTPGAPCTGTYKNVAFSGLAELGDLILDPAVNGGAFYDCQVTRFHNFALGIANGELGLQASSGAAPARPDADVLTKYRSLFEHDNYNVRELLRALFTGDEFLSSQAS